MKSYQSLLESFELLTEDRIDYLKNQYKDKLSTDHDQLAKHKESDKIIDHFASKADPSTGKVHTQWLVGQYAKKNIRQEDAPQLKSTLNDFALVKDNLEKKDLNQYKDVGELRDAIATQKATVEKKIKAKKAEAEEKSAGMEKLYDEDGVTGYKIPNRAASIKNYGPAGVLAQTHWCTAANSDNNMFNHYKGGKYTMHFPNGEVLQYHHQSGQIMDRYDRPVQEGDPRFAEHEHHIAKFINQTAKNESGESSLMKRFKHYEPEEIEQHLSQYEKAASTKQDARDMRYHSSHEHLASIATHAPLSDEHFDRIKALPSYTDYWGNKESPNYNLGSNKKLTHGQVGKLLATTNKDDRNTFMSQLMSNRAVKGEHLDHLISMRGSLEDKVNPSIDLATNPHLQQHHIDELIKDKNTHKALSQNHGITLTPEHQKQILASGEYNADFASRKDLHPDTIDHLTKHAAGYTVEKLIENPHAQLSDQHVSNILDRKRTDGIHMGGKLFASPKISPESRDKVFDQALRHPMGVELSDIVKSRFMTKDHVGRMLDAHDFHKEDKPDAANTLLYHVVNSPKASSEHLTRIIGSLNKNNSGVIRPLLDNKNLKPVHLAAIHDFIANPENKLTGYNDSVLEHPSANADILHSVFDKGHNLNKTAVLHHPAVQASHFQKAMDHGQVLHGAITSSPSAPPSVLGKLADSPFSFVRQNIASHKNTDNDTLKKLANDSNEEIAATAKKRLKIK